MLQIISTLIESTLIALSSLWSGRLKSHPADASLYLPTVSSLSASVVTFARKVSIISIILRVGPIKKHETSSSITLLLLYSFEIRGLLMQQWMIRLVYVTTSLKTRTEIRHPTLNLWQDRCVNCPQLLVRNSSAVEEFQRD